MQREISNKIRLGENLSPLEDVSNVPSIHNVVNLRDVFGKVDKLGALWDFEEADASLDRYIPGLTDVSRQGQLYSINAKKAYAAQTYVDQKTLEFKYSSMCVVLLILIFKK